MRVPGLPIRDCAESCDSSVQMCTTVNAIDVTENVFLERLYLVSGLGTFGPWVSCPYAPTTPTVYTPTISRYHCKFFPRMAPQFFCHHDSPSNLAGSRYPRVHPKLLELVPAGSYDIRQDCMDIRSHACMIISAIWVFLRPIFASRKLSTDPANEDWAEREFVLDG